MINYYMIYKILENGIISNSKSISGMNGLLGLQQVDSSENTISGTILY